MDGAPRRAPLWSGLVLSIVAWWISRIAVGLRWGPARNPLFFDASPWGRGDTFNYLAISEHGSTFGRCPALVQYFHQTWCGTVAWLPGYPWVIAVARGIGISEIYSAMVISWTAFGVALFLVWCGWGRDLPALRSLVLLVLFALFPGCVYDFGFFPTSLALACIVGSVLAATRERFFVGAVLMVAAGLCYPSAWFAAGGLAIALSLVLLSNSGAWTRSIALAAPCVLCLRRAPTPVLCLLLVVVAVTSSLISHAFFVIPT